MNITAALTQIENNFPEAAAAIREYVEKLSNDLHQMTHNCVGAEMERDEQKIVLLSCFRLLGLNEFDGQDIQDIPDAIECLKADHAAVTGERE